MLKTNNCHDCKREIKIIDNQITNGVELVYKDNGEKIAILKCKECYEKNPALTNYKECEVYSRVVGYLRPVQQWHTGKKQEFKDRQNFKAN